MSHGVVVAGIRSLRPIVSVALRPDISPMADDRIPPGSAQLQDARGLGHRHREAEGPCSDPRRRHMPGKPLQQCPARAATGQGGHARRPPAKSEVTRPSGHPGGSTRRPGEARTRSGGAGARRRAGGAGLALAGGTALAGRPTRAGRSALAGGDARRGRIRIKTIGC